MKVFLESIIAKFRNGDLTFVEVLRGINEWSGKILAMIDGTPVPMGATTEVESDDVGEIGSLYAELYEMVHGDPPAMEADANAAGAIDPVAVFTLLMQLAQLLRKRR